MASPLVTPRDLLAPAGEPASLEVEVERRFGPFLDPAVRGAEVEVEGVGRATTDEHGQAVFALGPLPSGTRRLRVRSGGSEVEAVVAAIPREAPVFITDIDHTIADVSSVGFIFRGVSSVRAMDGSRDALERISRAMQIVYLTARDHIFTEKTRAWLRLRGFPEAPIYLRRRTRFWTVSPHAHKVSRLRELRLGFPNIRWGVGDLPGDAAAYAAHGIPPILISSRAPAALPDGTIHVTHWSEITRRVVP